MRPRPLHHALGVAVPLLDVHSNRPDVLVQILLQILQEPAKEMLKLLLRSPEGIKIQKVSRWWKKIRGEWAIVGT
jgi:hypothetical protein